MVESKKVDSEPPRKKYHYIYKTTNTITGRYYIGMHSTFNLDDGYIGSGLILRRSLSKYGINSHQKKILEYAENREELASLERDLVTEETVNDPLSMNLKLGGEGGGGWTQEQQKANNKRSQESQRKLWEENGKWAQQRRKDSREHFLKLRKEGKILPPKPHIPGEFKHSPEAKKKIGKKASIRQKGESNNQFGKRWVCHPETKENKHIQKDEFDYWLAQGWVRGKITKQSSPESLRPCLNCGKLFKNKLRRVKCCSQNCTSEFVKQRNSDKEKERMEMIKSSDIDFTKYGWMAKVARVLDKDVMTIKKWMTRYLPEIYNLETTYKRKR